MSVTLCSSNSIASRPSGMTARQLLFCGLSGSMPITRPFGSAERGQEVEQTAVGADVLVGRLKAAAHRHRGRRRGAQIHEVHILDTLVSDLPLSDRHDEPAPVSGEVRQELPLRMGCVGEHARSAAASVPSAW